MDEIIWRIKRRVLSLVYIFINYHYFGKIGRHVSIISPLQISGKKNMYIGNHVRINFKSWLTAKPLKKSDKVVLTIEDGCVIGHFNHIYATQSVIIEKDVLTADKVYISDNLHGYEDVAMPVIKQPIKQCKPVVIGEGSWLGEHVCVIGASIGKHCVVGANSVVVHDVPDYSVAVGAPARVIKKYDHKTHTWERV